MRGPKWKGSDKEPQLVVGKLHFSNNNSLIYLGWKCPDCGTVWSPYVESCRNCVAPAGEYTDTNIKTIKE